MIFNDYKLPLIKILRQGTNEENQLKNVYDSRYSFYLK